MPTPFNGKIALDVRDSTPDWAPFVPPGRRGLAERPDAEKYYRTATEEFGLMRPKFRWNQWSHWPA